MGVTGVMGDISGRDGWVAALPCVAEEAGVAEVAGIAEVAGVEGR